jgi:hypothetical protein
MPLFHRLVILASSRWVVACFVLLGPPALLLRAQALTAQEVAVPVDVQVPLFVKILSFDRNLSTRAHGEVVLGVLCQGKYRTSSAVASEVQREARRMAGATIGGLPVRVVVIDLDETPDLVATLHRLHVTVLYVSPLRAVDVRSVTKASRAAQITTLTGVPRYVETGLAIGIDMKGERPEIMVNLAASRAEGADLNAQLLKLARIVQ